MTLSDHCLAPVRAVDAPVDGAAGRYERLFPELPALSGEEDALLALGTAGGVCELPTGGQRFGLTHLLFAYGCTECPDIRL